MTAGYYSIFECPLGELLVAGNDHAITHVARDVDAFIKAHASTHQQASAESPVGKAPLAIRAFLYGDAHAINLPLAPEGTPFQQDVWNALLRIPFAQTRSYSEIASIIGRPDTFRAVANACGSNPMPLIIPCHRAVHKNGTESGFAWGVEIKRMLLELEAAPLKAKAAA